MHRVFGPGCRPLAVCAAVLACAAAGAQDRVRESAAAVVSGAGSAAAFTERAASPPRVPEERRRELGGIAINTRNGAPWPAPDIEGITVVRLDAADAAEFQVLAPFDTTLGWVGFSPDGAWLSYVVIRDTGVEQWVAEIASGIPRPLTSASLNAAWGEPCRWLADSSAMLCRFLVSARGAPPEDEDALAGYYFTSQLGTVELATGRRGDLGAPGLFVSAEQVPGSGQLLAVRLGDQSGADAAARVLQRSVEILDMEGNPVRRLADLPAGGAAAR